MIDIEKAKKAFQEYIKQYDQTEYKIKLKKEHTGRVALVSRQIAEKLQLTKEQMELAELIGLLHDIGRFEQLKRYGTFQDKNSVDHAELGVSILFDQGKIRDYIEEDIYDEIIKKAVKNHNKYAIEEGLNEEELLQAKIIRDADKTDIFYIHTHGYWEEVFKKVDPTKEYISEYVIKTMQKEELTNNEKVVTVLDNCIGNIAFIYDYNFKESLEIVKEKKYITDSINYLLTINFKEEVKEQIREIKKLADQYLAKQ